MKAVSEACNVPLRAPMTSDGLDTGVNSDVYKGRFSGFCNHYNVHQKRMIVLDCTLIKC